MSMENSLSQSDLDYMTEALACVESASHRVSPNPMVGCVIVKDHTIVGYGVTEPPGQRHAEVVALDEAGAQAYGADMYVTLEPCCHTGRTSPCTEAIIQAGIRRVFIGAIDPNPVVHGKGVSQLKNAGIETTVGVLADQCQAQLAAFRQYILKHRPWVILKAATTLDGRIATRTGDSKWITGPAARRDAHRLRARVDAILIGGETVRLDDPELTVRDAPGTTPMRVVLDGQANIPLDSRILGEGTLIFHGSRAPSEHLTKLQATGTRTIEVASDHMGLDLNAILSQLVRHGVICCMVEGGGRLHGSFLRDGLANEAWFYIAARLIGEGRPLIAGTQAERIQDGWTLTSVDTLDFDGDLRLRGRIQYPSDSVDPPRD